MKRFTLRVPVRFWLSCIALAVMFSGAIAVLAKSARFPDAKDLPIHKDLPNPLLTSDGRSITNAVEWSSRRAEMKRIIQHYFTGTPPPPPGNVTGRDVATEMLRQGTVKLRRVHLSFGPKESLGFDAAIFTPAKGNGPFPTIVHPSFFPIPGTTAPPLGDTTNGLSPKAIERALERQKLAVHMANAENAAQAYGQALDRGYAVMVFFYQQCGADKREYRDTGFFAAYPDYDWSDLAAWAWGMSRCVDYLETQPFVDRGKLIALGHSRLGKATLVAGAFDERFALVAPAGSGCAGTGAFRFCGKNRGGKEGLEEVVANFPQWISPRLAQFSGQVEKLPFDQHWLIALVAPRAFIAADGLNDAACNGNALKQSYLAAQPVYDLLGAGDHLGIHFRPGQHALAEADWRAILDFADWHLRGMKVNQRFDELPPSGQLH